MPAKIDLNKHLAAARAVLARAQAAYANLPWDADAALVERMATAVKLAAGRKSDLTFIR